jgi:hypothetical protein
MLRGWLSGSAAVLCLGVMLAGGSSASAQDEGVHVDPNSPAGKEYALPLDSARRDSDGGTTPSGGTSSHSAPLFGTGISDSGGSSGGEGSGSNAGGGKAGASGTSDSAPGGASARGVDSTQAAARAVAPGGGGLSAGVLTLLIAFGVVAVGILIGLSVRALRGDHSPV